MLNHHFSGKTKHFSKSDHEAHLVKLYCISSIMNYPCLHSGKENKVFFKGFLSNFRCQETREKFSLNQIKSTRTNK